MLGKILEKYLIQFNEKIRLTGLTIHLDKSQPSEIVFYTLHSTPASQSLFRERLDKGLAALVIVIGEEVSGCPHHVKFLNAVDAKKLKRELLDYFYPMNGKMKFIGVTGTNGKSSVVHLVAQILAMNGKRALSLGTLGLCTSNGEILEDLSMTTPSEIEIRQLVSFYGNDYDFLCLEVSSHALSQERLNGLEFQAAGWTSFSQDHLDYHKTIEEYFLTKTKILDLVIDKSLYVPNLEKDLIEKLKDYNIHLCPPLSDKVIEKLPLFFQKGFNRSNLELACALAQSVIGDSYLKNCDFEKISLPKGRFNLFEVEGILVIVDYAHTPDALRSIGFEVKRLYPYHSISTVFGCGGNRDRSKRPLMRKAVESFSDSIIITSDNPRDEDPKQIIDEIIFGGEGVYQIEVDRKKAIELALNKANKKTVVIIAGKGHEEYQEIKGVKRPFSDTDTVKNWQKKL